MMKIDAIRISLCLSVKALYSMTKRNKRYACNPIIEHPLALELFRFFTHYVKYSGGEDFRVLKYVVKVIKILQNCSEVASLCKSLLAMDVVKQLSDVARKVLADEFGTKTSEVRTSVLMPILKTFDQLNQGDLHDWHLQKNDVRDVCS